MPYTTGLGGRFLGLSFPITTNYTGAVFVFFLWFTGSSPAGSIQIQECISVVLVWTSTKRNTTLLQVYPLHGQAGMHRTILNVA